MNRVDNNSKMMNDLLALSHVPRWAIIAHNKPQSVAEHSFRAAIIYLELLVRLDMRCTYEALLYALLHDGAEAWTGDIPGPFKAEGQSKVDHNVAPWVEHVKSRVDPLWIEIFKMADLIETGTFIRRHGIGGHAIAASRRILYQELCEKAAILALKIGWGPERLTHVVSTLVDDILQETGRWN